MTNRLYFFSTEHLEEMYWRKCCVQQNFKLSLFSMNMAKRNRRLQTPIADCGFKNRVLLTGDRDLVHTWAKEIVDASIAVFVTTDNSEGPQQWGPRIIAARVGILHELRRRHKPFTATISREGSISQVRLYEGSRWKGIEIKKKSPSNFYRKK